MPPGRSVATLAGSQVSTLPLVPSGVKLAPIYWTIPGSVAASSTAGALACDGAAC